VNDGFCVAGRSRFGHFAMVVGLLFISGSTSASAPRNVNFACTVKGLKLLSEPMTAKNICYAFKTKIEQSLGYKMLGVTSAQLNTPTNVRWVLVNCYGQNRT
jgi:hypothetical protein